VEFDVIEEVPKNVRQISVEKIDENSVLKYSDIFSKFHFVKLETQDSSLIGRVDKIIATEDKFVILDASIAKMVFVFDKNGLFLNRIGNNGGGPEEYDCPDDIAYDKYNDEILVWCSNYKSIFRFKLSGTFVKKIQTSWWASSIIVAAKDTYCLYLNNLVQKGGSPNEYNILVLNENGKVVKRLLPLNKDTKNLSPSNKNAFTLFQDTILFSPQYSNRIFTLHQDEIIPKYYVNFHNHNIPLSTLIDVTSRELTKIIKESDYAFNISAIETTSHVVCQFVYNKKIFDAYYSKHTQATKVSSIYLNDMYGMVSNRAFVYAKGDLLISFVNPQSFIEIRDVIKEVKSNKISIKNILQKQLSSMSSIFVNNELKRNYAKEVECIDIELTKEEVDFINSIQESDNPILLVAKLKEF
jgi:hypothetical protein